MSQPKQPGGILPCVTCGHPTRPWKQPSIEAPGTLQRRMSGQCKRCHEPNKAVVRITEAGEEARVAETRHQLDLYLRGRDERRARALRMLA